MMHQWQRKCSVRLLPPFDLQLLNGETKTNNIFERKIRVALNIASSLFDAKSLIIPLAASFQQTSSRERSKETKTYEFTLANTPSNAKQTFCPFPVFVQSHGFTREGEQAQARFGTCIEGDKYNRSGFQEVLHSPV